MSSLRRSTVFRLGVVFGLAALSLAPTPVTLAVAGQHAETLDPVTFFELKRERDCQKCGECQFTSNYCSEVCSADYEAPTLPEGCVPLVHDGEVCLDALEAASCSEYRDYTQDQGRLLPSECQLPGDDALTPRALVVIAAFTVGCAVGRQIITPRAQYQLYRETRLAPTVEARLAAANRYLHVAPNGAYAPELHAWFDGAERAYVTSAHDRLPFLLAYAKGLPDGPSIGAVHERIEELEAAERFAQKRASARDERVESLEAALERAATQRKTFVAELTAWIGALAAVRSYGQPLSALPRDVLERFAIGDPAAGCPLDVCASAAAPRFAIPSAATQLIPREAGYTAELTLASGAVAAARLHGRELFSRVGEALDLRPVSFSDPQSRAEAIGRALLVIQNALGTSLAADGCERPAVSPVVLERNCDGLHVTVTAAVDPGADDVIAFGPETKPPPAAPAGKRPKH